MRCLICKKVKKQDPRFVLMVKTMMGYDNYKFCSKKCLIKYLEKKYKLLKW